MILETSMITEVSGFFLSSVSFLCLCLCWRLSLSVSLSFADRRHDITLSGGKCRVRRESGNKDRSRGSVSHRCTRLISYQWSVLYELHYYSLRLIKDQCFAQEKASWFLYTSFTVQRSSHKLL